MAIPVYPSDLSDAERTLLGPVLPPAKSSGRPRSVDLRRILNDLCNLVCSGCAWRSVHLLICSSAHLLAPTIVSCTSPHQVRSMPRRMRSMSGTMVASAITVRLRCPA